MSEGTVDIPPPLYTVVVAKKYEDGGLCEYGSYDSWDAAQAEAERLEAVCASPAFVADTRSLMLRRHPEGGCRCACCERWVGASVKLMADIVHKRRVPGGCRLVFDLFDVVGVPAGRMWPK